MKSLGKIWSVRAENVRLFRRGSAGRRADGHVVRAIKSSPPGIKKSRANGTTFFEWWERVDSNHRSRRQQIYSLPPLATRERSHMQLSWLSDSGEKDGAGRRTRTPDLLITNQLLYQLSYTSTFSNV